MCLRCNVKVEFALDELVREGDLHFSVTGQGDIAIRGNRVCAGTRVHIYYLTTGYRLNPTQKQQENIPREAQLGMVCRYMHTLDSSPCPLHKQFVYAVFSVRNVERSMLNPCYSLSDDKDNQAKYLTQYILWCNGQGVLWSVKSKPIDQVSRSIVVGSLCR